MRQRDTDTSRPFGGDLEQLRSHWYARGLAAGKAGDNRTISFSSAPLSWSNEDVDAARKAYRDGYAEGARNA